MRRQTVDWVLATLYALAAFAAVMAPSGAVWLTANRGGMGDGSGLDLVLTSLLIGGVDAVLAWRRLRDEERVAVRRADIWIAAVNALVVQAFGVTLLLVVLLHSFAAEHSWMAEQNYPVVALWAGIQVLAVLLAEATGRLVFRWLEPHPVAGPTVPGPADADDRGDRHQPVGGAARSAG